MTGETSPIDLWNLLEERVAASPDAEMLVSADGERVTFAEYHQRALTVAAGLHDLGVSAGDVVSWILPTWTDTVVLAAALARLGAVQNPIIAIYRDREVGFCARQAGASLLVTPGRWRGFDYASMGERIAGSRPDLAHLVVEPGRFPAGDPATLPPTPDVDPDAIRWLAYTSGTTADPKGARHSDRSVGVVGMSMAENMDVVAGDRYALVFPFPHIGGIALLFMSLGTGCTHLLDEAFDPARTIGFLSREDCTHAGTGTAFHLMYLTAQRARPDAPLFPHLKACPGGGAPKPPTLHARVKAELGGVGIVSGWGLTEAPILTFGSVHDPDDKLATTEGRPMPGVSLRAVRENGTVAGPGEEGELRAKGPQVMAGYVDASLDAEAFDADGWFRTGDLGFIDAEGYVTITGRLKDVIIRNAENISAKEVEDLLFTHPVVDDVAVIGLPDERTGEQVCAVVVTAEDASLDLDDVRRFLAEAGLRRQAVPERLEIVDALPRNPAGKILKRELQSRFG